MREISSRNTNAEGNPPEVEPLRTTPGLAECPPDSSTVDNTKAGVVNRSLAVAVGNSMVARACTVVGGQLAIIFLLFDEAWRPADMVSFLGKV